MTVPYDRERAAAFARALSSVGASRPLSDADLDALSAPLPAEVTEFRAIWDRLDSERRRALLQELRTAAEQRLRLDFAALNYLGLEDSSPEVRLAAVQGSLDDRSPHLLQRLLTMVADDPSPAVRQAATEELARFALLGELEDLDPVSTSRVRQALLARIADQAEADTIRTSAVAALGYFSDEDVAEMLVGAFGEPSLRLGALRGMGRSADPRWTDRLMPVLGSEDPRQREEAAVALGEIEDERAVGPLAELLDDPDQAVRLAAVAALGAIGGEEAREALLYLAEDPDEVLRAAVDRALSDIEFYEDPAAL